MRLTTILMLLALLPAASNHLASTLPVIAGPGIADAATAAIVLPAEVSIEDHYGDPDRFIKYIIRKPPVLA